MIWLIPLMWLAGAAFFAWQGIWTGAGTFALVSLVFFIVALSEDDYAEEE